MKKLILVFPLLLFFALSVFSQTEEAQKIDEFENPNCEEYLARTDAMMNVQGNNPNAKIYVIIYEGKQKRAVYKKRKGYADDEFVGYKSIFPTFGLANVSIKSMKKRLSLRKMALDNYVFVKGGFRENFGVEIWLVPPGAEPPKPMPTLEKMKYRKGKAKGFCLDCCGP